mmetsp:Transcript_27532/g.60594  ORF Transcript_27532/g.60594 Transcript_27532/m.60594 type:complete len:275 (+) Transcript_27532:1054-1878(+)
MHRPPRFVVLSLFVKAGGGQVFPPRPSTKEIRGHAHDRLALKSNFFGQVFRCLGKGAVDIAQNEDALDFLGRELRTRCGKFPPIGKIPVYGVLVNPGGVTLVQSLVVAHADGTFLGPFSLGLDLPQSFEGIAVGNGSIFSTLQKWFHGIPAGHNVGLDVGLVASRVCHDRSTQTIDDGRSAFVIVHDFGVGSPNFGVAQGGIFVVFFTSFLFVGWQGCLDIFSLVFLVQIGFDVDEILSLLVGKFLRLGFRLFPLVVGVRRRRRRAPATVFFVV